MSLAQARVPVQSRGRGGAGSSAGTPQRGEGACSPDRRSPRAPRPEGGNAPPRIQQERRAATRPAPPPWPPRQPALQPPTRETSLGRLASWRAASAPPRTDTHTAAAPPPKNGARRPERRNISFPLTSPAVPPPLRFKMAPSAPRRLLQSNRGGQHPGAGGPRRGIALVERGTSAHHKDALQVCRFPFASTRGRSCLRHLHVGALCLVNPVHPSGWEQFSPQPVLCQG
ncbi:uncharacterized protein LOC111816724 [Octodon degus]|uniref:Uncharacterized protein LOC111816724 n=1 Tax=Octodon degus TaxID=10160 RepID=A0A6P6EEU3_OCTDE|nr:uncharacterized protein LOC111816724 [Octodon degus]